MAYRNPRIYLAASAAYFIDEKTRIELNKGNIVSERDYVSNLTKGIRDFWANVGLPAFSYSRSLNQSEENVFGCDGLILLKYVTGIKVCLFEAKYPRFITPSYPWDKIVNNKSHFTDQIHRQRNWTGQCAIWELFIDEHLPQMQPGSLDDFGSTCISHHDTDLYDRAFRAINVKWSTADIFALLGSFKAKYHNIKYMLQRAAQCYDGKIIRPKKGSILLISKDQEHSIKIPSDLHLINDMIPGFMEEHNLSDFLFLDFSGQGRSE